MFFNYYQLISGKKGTVVYCSPLNLKSISSRQLQQDSSILSQAKRYFLIIGELLQNYRISPPDGQDCTNRE